MIEWRRIYDPQIRCLHETHLRKKIYIGWKWRDRKNIPGKWSWKKAWVAIILTKQTTNKGHNKRQKGHDINIQSNRRYNPCEYIYVPHTGTPKYVKKTLEDFKKEINSNVVTVRDFNTSLSTMDRSSRQNINKHIVALNNTLDQMDLIYI